MFCNADRDTYCATPDTVKAALTPRTKAVIVVDLFGNVAPVTDELAHTHLALPVSAAMGRDQVDEVVAAVRDADLG